MGSPDDEFDQQAIYDAMIHRYLETTDGIPLRELLRRTNEGVNQTPVPGSQSIDQPTDNGGKVRNSSH